MNRRHFLLGLGAIAAPAVIRTPGLLMPVKRIVTSDVLVFDDPLLDPVTQTYMQPEPWPWEWTQMIRFRINAEVEKFGGVTSSSVAVAL